MNHFTQLPMPRRGRVRDRAKEAFWREQVRRQQADGLGAGAFCRREGLAEATFYYWRKQIALRDNAGDAPLAGRASSGSGRSATASGPGFVELRAVTSPSRPSAPRAACGVGLELRLPRRRRVMIRPGFDADLLRQVLAVLEPATVSPARMLGGISHREDHPC